MKVFILKEYTKEKDAIEEIAEVVVNAIVVIAVLTIYYI